MIPYLFFNFRDQEPNKNVIPLFYWNSLPKAQLQLLRGNFIILKKNMHLQKEFIHDKHPSPIFRKCQQYCDMYISALTKIIDKKKGVK